MSGVEMKMRMQNIAKLKDEITQLTANLAAKKLELKELLPTIETYMNNNEIDEVQMGPTGNYKVCKKARLKQPTLSKKFLTTKVDEFLVSKNIRNIQADEIIEYIFESRKSMGIQIDEVEVRKMTNKKRKAADNHVDLESVPEETVFIANRF